MGGEYTVTEAAAVLGVSRCRVLQFLKEGRLSARRKGPIWLIPVAAVRKLAKIPREAGRPKVKGAKALSR